MKQALLILLILMMLPLSVFALDSYYCPGNHKYINTGMTQDEVINACGQPIKKEQSNQPVTEKVPVTQLIYNNQGTGEAFYGVWSVPTGYGGARLEVDIINNKVASARINGSSTNAFSICGSSVEVGSPVAAVYNTCGNPSLVNKTYINRILPGDNKTEIWTYQADQYQPSVTLTFVNGRLQSIVK